MNIVIKEDKNTKNKQPKVYNLGNVTTTIQDLLDNSKIIINGEQTIVLKIDNNFYLLDLKDYKNNDVYGLGSNVLESDLISLSSLSSNIKPYLSYVFMFTQDTEIDMLGNSQAGDPIITYSHNETPYTFTFIRTSTGEYVLTANAIIFDVNKLGVIIGSGQNGTIQSNFFAGFQGAPGLTNTIYFHHQFLDGTMSPQFDYAGNHRMIEIRFY